MPTPKTDEFGSITAPASKTTTPKAPTSTPFGQAGSAPAKSTGTPFGQAAPTTLRDAAVANPTVGNISNWITELKGRLVDMNIAAGLNPDGTAKVETPLTRVQKNAATEAAGPPGPAPAGFRYSFIPSVDGGSWKLYSTGSTPPATKGTTGGTGTTDTTSTIDETGKKTPSTSLDVLKAMLKSQGLTSTIIDSSASYLNSLLKDGLDYDNAVQVFLNTKDYTLKNGTKLDSPFYTAYGYLNEGLTKPKTASELFNAVEGYKELKTKYGFSDKYLSAESLKNYVKNNVTVADLDERANAARLAGITTDPSKTAAFIQLGYIKTPAELQDFYMDSKLGKEQMETNRNTGAFVAEAIRRAKSGILTDTVQTENYKKIAAELTAKGYSEAQVAQLASTGFEKISQELTPLATYAGIYEKAGGTEKTNAELISSLQTELQQEEFSNMASARRKKLEEQNIKAYQGSAGTTASSLKSTYLA